MTYNELFTRVLPGLGVPDVWACSLGARETRPGLFLFPNEALIRIPFFWIWTTGYMSGETSSKHCSMALSLRLNMTLPSAQVMLIRSPGFRLRSKRMERHCSKLCQYVDYNNNKFECILYSAFTFTHPLFHPHPQGERYDFTAHNSCRLLNNRGVKHKVNVNNVY